jgi:hypothetical protein
VTVGYAAWTACAGIAGWRLAPSLAVLFCVMWYTAGALLWLGLQYYAASERGDASLRDR